MNKTLSAMVAGAALFLASQASAVTLNLATLTGASGATGIAGITYSTVGSSGSSFPTGFPGTPLAGDVTASNAGVFNGLGVKGPNDAAGSGAKTIDTREAGLSVVGAWEMLTVSFSAAVNLTDFLLARFDANDDFEYSLNGGAFTTVAAMNALAMPTGSALDQPDVNFFLGAWNKVTSFSIRVTGTTATDDDDFLLREMKISAVPLPAGGLLLLGGLAGLAALRRRKQAA